MRPVGWVLVVVAAGAVCRGAEPSDKPDAPAKEMPFAGASGLSGTDLDTNRIGRLVGRLSSPDFRERETASRELDRLGDAALAPLREAARTGDAETRRRAAELVERIAQRQTTARLLAPTYVNLNYDRTPLAEAIADLSRRTGMAITLYGDAAKLEGRAVTLTAQKVSTWQAIRLFCDQAGLHEGGGPAPDAGAIGAASEVGADRPEGVLVLGQIQVRRGQVSAVTAPSPLTRVALVDGAGRFLPSHYAGAVRVRVISPGVSFPPELGKDAVVELQVTAEDRLHVDGATDLRIERAVDERGRERMCRPAWTDPPDTTDDWTRGARMPPQLVERKHGPVAIRFPRDDAPLKRLRELAGVVTVQVFAAEPAIEFDRPAEAVGKTVRRGDVVVSLVNWSSLPAGEVRVSIEAQLPYGTRLDQPVGGSSLFAGRGGRFAGPWGGIQAGEPDPVAASGQEFQGLSIDDSVGRRFSPETGATCLVGLFPQHYTVRVTAKYRPPAAGAAPARVQFAVRRPTTVDVPFLLRDVPVP